jgi:ubiquinone/menaquinone biosynthesis C-methylase UbiE
MRAGLEALRWSDPERFAARLLEVVRDARLRFPPPATLPFFGLDLPEGTSARRLESLSAMGIFRQYERVLEVPTRLGGAARWLATRHGCRVVSFGSDPRAARAAGRLTRQAGLEGRVAFAVADLATLPVAKGSFTHAWSPAGLRREGPRSAVFRELWRALRPGGQVGLQELVAVGTGRLEPQARFPRLQEIVEDLHRAGFERLRAVELEVETETGGPVEEVLARRLEEPSREVAGAIEIAPSAPGADIRWVQVFGHKPG